MPKLRIRIEPNSKAFVVEIDETTTIRELFEYFQSEILESQGQNNSNNQSYQQWTCCLVQENRFLSLNNRVPSYPCELLINTQPNVLNTALPQSNKQQQSNQPSYQNTPTQQQPSQQQQENINLRITIQDGNQQRNLNITFSSNSTLEDVGAAVLIFCGLNAQVAAVDLELFNNQFNKPEKRNKTLSQLQIQSNIELTARIRWIGG